MTPRRNSGSVRTSADGSLVATAIRSGVAGSVTVARPGRAASTESMSAASATVVASGPFSLMPSQASTPISCGTRPAPGLSPKRPQLAAGIRIEPMPSLPCAIVTNPDATAAALPPDEPPGVRLRFHGLWLIPYTESVAPNTQSSGTRVSPTTTAPASQRRATTGWSAADGASDVAAEPSRSGSPATGMLSLIATGTPASGRLERSARASTAAASARARSARTSWNAPTSSDSMRARAARVASTAVVVPARTEAARSTAVASSGADDGVMASS